MADSVIVAIDCGTQSVRALAFDPRGNILARSRIPIEPYFSDHPGWAEQHADYYWDRLCDATGSLLAGAAFSPDAIKGVALTTQRGTVVDVDIDGKPLRPAIVWLDQRRCEGLPALGGLWGVLFKLAGVSDTVAAFQANGEDNWIHKHQPDVWKKVHKHLLLSGYLTYRLVGQYVDSVACQVGYFPFDYKHLKWAKPRDWKWQSCCVTREQLPELIPPGEPLGAITKVAAAATGLPEGVPLIAAAADKACEVLGAGCLDPDVGCLSFGTTATINTTRRDYLEVIPLVPPYPAALPGAYNTELMIFRGFWMVSWFKQQFGHPERMLAEQQGTTAEQLFDKLVADVPPGSMGLMLQPYWSPGIREPGPEAKGAIMGFGDVHTRAHVYRAILEGLVYALREWGERIEKRGKTRIQRLRVAGGGSQSDAAMQITADMFGLPAARPHTHDTSALGAAIDAAVGLKLHSDFKTAISEMTRVGDVFEPSPKAVEVYDALFRRVYKKMYQQLRPLYAAIRDITGYPP